MERNKTVTRPEIRRWLRCKCTCHVLFISTNSRVVVLGKSCQLPFKRLLPKVDLHSNVVKGSFDPLFAYASGGSNGRDKHEADVCG